MSQLIGQPLDRVDGPLKVTGQAKYAAEFSYPGLVHAVTVQSTISNGRIRNMDLKRAENAPGVLAIMTWQNAPRLHSIEQPAGGSNADVPKLGEKNLLPLQSDKIYYNGQHIAVVIANSFEQAEYAAGLIQVDYDEETPKWEIEQAKDEAYQPKDSLGRKLQLSRGNTEEALSSAPVRLDQTYSTPVYHHNPMEPHATVAWWEDNSLTVYDATQNVMGSRDAVAMVLGIPKDNVRLLSPFIGGGFGCKGFVWHHTFLAPMAAMKVGRPVKLVLSRQQMFTSNGHRSRTIQTISLGADNDGKLTAIRHDVLAETSFVDEFVETSGLPSSRLYACPNLQVTHSMVKLNKGTPCPTRAPGEATGTYAMEVAMDELAYQLKMDPIGLRLRNYADNNPHTQQPWSEKNLKECYEKGAAAIGWQHRNPSPGMMKEGIYLVGYGMATSIYPANRVAASAAVRILPDGHAIAACCTQDIGTGTYTIMTQIAAEALGLPPGKVEFRLGDSRLPKGPGSGGSQTAASVGPAVRAAALEARKKAIGLALTDKRSPLFGQPEENIVVEDGHLFPKDQPARRDSYAQIIARQRLPKIEGEGTTNVSTRETGSPGAEAPNATAGQPVPKRPENKNPAAREDESVPRKNYAFQSFGAQFAKVLIHPDTRMIKVARMVSVMDIGKVLNAKTARSQIMGGMIFGLGMALMEETVYDPQTGRVITMDLANYHVPVHADMPEFEIHFLDKPDPFISPIGARGIGEIGITGAAAAVANAVYHATGRRIRDLPITPDKLL
ncbi:MAG TPA: xanthine dehydrogenase family protein molybdopterin-binding subunit [Puia sp.]